MNVKWEGGGGGGRPLVECLLASTSTLYDLHHRVEVPVILTQLSADNQTKLMRYLTHQNG